VRVSVSSFCFCSLVSSCHCVYSVATTTGGEDVKAAMAELQEQLKTNDKTEEVCTSAVTYMYYSDDDDVHLIVLIYFNRSPNYSSHWKRLRTRI